MKSEWMLTRETFDNLLSWLSPDRDGAGQKYEELRLKLIRLFTCRGCDISEELADETINRVIKAMELRGWEYSGEPILFFFAVAKRVFLEWLRIKPIELEDIIVWEPTGREEHFECLEDCMGQLPKNSRSLIRRYYEHDGQEKIRLRQLMANELGIGMNALRIQACRIRDVLRACMFSCIAQKATNQEELS